MRVGENIEKEYISLNKEFRFIHSGARVGVLILINSIDDESMIITITELKYVLNLMKNFSLDAKLAM